MHKLRYVLFTVFCILPIVAMEQQNKKNHSKKKVVGPKTYAEAVGLPNNNIITVSYTEDTPKITLHDEIKHTESHNTLTTTPAEPTQSLEAPSSKETTHITVETPTTINFSGLGVWSGLKDTVWGTGPNLIAELNNKSFQVSHPSNQGRIYQAIKYQINKDQMDDMAILFGLLAKIESFKVENKEAMKLAYQYLKKQKMVSIESDAKKTISELITTNQKQLQDQVESCKTTFGSELPKLQREMETILQTLNNSIAKHLAIANTCKKARLNCITLTPNITVSGYDSDSDGIQEYSEEMFLKRKNINLHDTVNNFKESLAENKGKLQKIQDQFDAIKLAPAITNKQ